MARLWFITSTMPLCRSTDRATSAFATAVIRDQSGRRRKCCPSVSAHVRQRLIVRARPGWIGRGLGPRLDGNPSTTRRGRRPHPPGHTQWPGSPVRSVGRGSQLVRLWFGSSVGRRRWLHSPCDQRVRRRDAARWSRRDRHRAPDGSLMARFVARYVDVMVWRHDPPCDQRVREPCCVGLQATTSVVVR
jgi:hypothetical protein